MASATWVTVGVALGGVVVGAAASYATSARIVRLQQRAQEQHEIWTRVLNSYQDFTNYGRQLVDFAHGPDELWQHALQEAHRNANNARTLDPYGHQRVQRMTAVLRRLEARTLQDRADVESELDAIFDDFYEDRRLGFARYGDEKGGAGRGALTGFVDDDGRRRADRD